MNKFRNVKTEFDGRTFDSKAECRYYIYLKGLQEQGLISGLKCQTRFNYVLNGFKIFTYLADFTYTDKDGQYHIIDVKSPATAKLPLFRLKKKIIEAETGLKVEVVQ